MNLVAILAVLFVIYVLAVYITAIYGPKLSIALTLTVVVVCFLGIILSSNTTPPPETRIQIVVLESDHPNADGSFNYTINVDPVGYLAPYKMAHEFGRLTISYKNLDLVLETLKEDILDQNPQNQVFILNNFES